MRVLLDARPLPGHRLGVAQYVLRLAELAASRCDLEVLAKASDVDDFPPPVHTSRDLPRPLRIATELLWDAHRVNRLAPDVFHGVHYTLPPGLRVPATVTFHDATMLTMPEVHERSKVLWFRRAIPAGIRRADRVICVSESARQGAIEHAGADPARTHTVPLAVDHDRFRPAAGPRPASVRGICDGPYLLWVGALEPRKDVPTLVEAFERLAAEVPHTLVLMGPDAWGAEAVTERIAASPVRHRIVRTGWVSEDTKADLYRHADAFAYPSLAEGFGLPVLEALACGTPTVTTTGSAPEEVAGDAALLVPPRDPDALAAAIARALGDDADRLRAAGPARAARFTWEATTAGTLAVWELACA
ncbi:MAG TPA: glycosyltransferase family 1 protein [Acidimicrobiales bacterium]|nr:glycosyltransferase family 1 protein [Acidimicrobiales bacterium]